MTSYFFRFLMVAILFFPFFSTGCGYSLRANGEPVGIVLESIAISLITSTSSVAGFEADFTRILREEFISHSKVPILPEEEAQAVLSGHVNLIRSEPLSYDLQQTNVSGSLVTHATTSRRRLMIALDISLKDNRTGKLIWHEKSMKEEASFDVDIDPLASGYSEKLALEKISGLLAKRIYLKTVERF